ncbi:hypothetical protein NZD89_29050 (plasmid) [Alicyclobacillus fastidiosus]|uniref:Transcriptional regulator n=1 Tax=Alicyclobacillus fastidiosus TaxID=392011 RepID=A0ABY6ZQ33_9BACL|nr:hypothetical protein [Alicyclobacillus fastidiosus]WAH44965.1 hypothetical protein NZD89_29050 [Alicyclobacillus fastidiosus]GMA66222.1 hypothetical protein GCM10025859_66640 [Alicyclobacillus fastidiosus]GMA66255.1 hypothetical protein GCM10025859_66970 [Alicyclobacillus fastidiosus]
MMQRKLKRVVVKQELVELTGDIFKAIILNQFVYWSERVYDFDKLISEERERMNEEGQTLNMHPTEGWIYKSADELNDETMLGISPATMGRHIKSLIDAGYLLSRNNPEHKWDRTKQYRVDFVKLCGDLAKLGYTLDGYPFSTETDANFNLKNGDSNLKDQDVQIERAIPEITTKIYTETTHNNNVAVIQEQIESHLGTSIASLSKHLPKWLKQYGENKLLDIARYIGSTPEKWDKSIVGAYRTAVTEDWDVSSAGGYLDEPVRDERYGNFYELFPEA